MCIAWQLNSDPNTAVQNQNAVSVNFTSKQLLPFGFAMADQPHKRREYFTDQMCPDITDPIIRLHMW